MTERHPHLLDASKAALFVIDVQKAFRPVMGGFEAMLAGCIRLVKTFHALDLPIFVTEQYPKGLGNTVDELKMALGTTDVPEKTVFSAYGCTGLPELIAESQAKQIVVCGIETHVCVNQTVHDLLADGYQVFVAVDAVESRHEMNFEWALRKMERSGASMTTSEMAAFELMKDAKHEKFKEIQSLFK